MMRSKAAGRKARAQLTPAIEMMPYGWVPTRCVQQTSVPVDLRCLPSRFSSKVSRLTRYYSYPPLWIKGRNEPSIV